MRSSPFAFLHAVWPAVTQKYNSVSNVEFAFYFSDTTKLNLETSFIDLLVIWAMPGISDIQCGHQ